jgi:protocatechuate 3,4-dioxygenase beta subunit
LTASSVQGEKIRSNLVEGEPGVPLHFEMQFIDTTTCKPATSLLVDVWSCNAMGIYSGVSAAGQGGLSTTYLRGVQPTDTDGVVEFDTIFPGHYGGRATHEHVITHSGATVLANGSYSGGHISHLSQLFFDQALIDAVEKTSPYNTNTIAKTLNNADGYTGYAATAAYDPFPEYVMLGDSLSQGLFMWVEIGINPTLDVTRYAPPAAYLAADGGHNNPSFDMSIVATPPSTHG